jgi:hypothetical protein
MRQYRVVGLGRLELPTSRLSSARSNQLSYRPKKVQALQATRRKRNVDGGIPQIRVRLKTLMFYEKPIETEVSEGFSLERR